jgi:hypothetical protein
MKPGGFFYCKGGDPMPYINPATVQKAKQIDLLTYLQTNDPQELIHISGNTYHIRTHDSLKISNGKWYWWSRGIGGKSALDYLIKVKELSFLKAVEEVLGKVADRPPVFLPREPPHPKQFLLPKAHHNTEQVSAYLLGRGIDSEIIKFCNETGRLYESRCYDATNDRTHVNAVFVGLDQGGHHRYAALRGVDSEFKGEAKGSDKLYAFSLPARRENPTLHLFESAIDLLSYATMIKLIGGNFKSANLLSLAGVHKSTQLPAVLTQYFLDHPHIKKVVLHLDNDVAGRLAAQSIMDVLPRQYEAVDAPPPKGKDVNDCLLLRLGLVKNREKGAWAR